VCSEQGLRPLFAIRTITRASAARLEWSGSRTWERNAHRVTNGVKIELLCVTPSAGSDYRTIASLRTSWKGRLVASSRELSFSDIGRRVRLDMGGLLTGVGLGM
jgi:hypothetical protein